MPAQSRIALTDVASGDEYDGSLPHRVDPAVIRELSELTPWVSSAHIVAEWGQILAAALLARHFAHPLSYALAVAFIGARQHALIVMAHDAAHYRLFRNRALNDWIGEIALAWPFLLFTMQAYRRNHFPHHRHVNTDADPDWIRKRTPEWAFPKTRVELAWMLFLDAVGIGFIKFVAVASKLPKPPPAGAEERRRILHFKIGRVAYFGMVASALSVLGLWSEYVLYWIVPYLTWMQLVFHVRSIAEHFAISGRVGVYGQTRTVLAGWLDRVFLGVKNVNYHLEHHLYPSVPFYRLPELHRLLQRNPEFRRAAHVTRGYLGVLKECVAGASA